MSQAKRLCYSLLLLLASAFSVAAQQVENTEKKVQNPIGAAEEEKKALRKQTVTQINITAQSSPKAADELIIIQDKVEAQGDVSVHIGNVQASIGDVHLITDRLT